MKLKNLQERFSHLLLGPNYERIDYIVDSFLKLSIRDRNITIISSVGVIFILFVLFIYNYFSSLSGLEHDLVSSHSYLHKIMKLKSKYKTLDDEYKTFVDQVASAKMNFNLKSFLNTIEQEKNLNLMFEDIREPSSLPSTMREDFYEKVVEVKCNKISIMTLVDFLRRIEASGKYLRINMIEIDKTYRGEGYFRIKLNVASLHAGQQS